MPVAEAKSVRGELDESESQFEGEKGTPGESKVSFRSKTNYNSYVLRSMVVGAWARASPVLSPFTQLHQYPSANAYCSVTSTGLRF